MKVLPLFAILASLLSLGSSKPTDPTSRFLHARGPNETLLQDVVTWDADSIFVRGERLFLFSGDFAPFRLPVPSLWLDMMQKIRAAGFNAISFYPDWALLEGKRGEVSMDGVFALEPFFDAAKEAGIYLIARPGPYIHSETAGGGLPGWMQRVKGTLRTTAPDYLSATDLYMKKVGAVIAKGQITNGGPVILVQVENEYSQFSGKETGPNGEYMQYVIDQARNAGIVVPIVNNDAFNNGIGAPGNGTGAVDIYGYDSYPIGVGCWNLYDWPAGQLKENYWSLHLEKSPDTPHYIAEFQGGSGSGWGDEGADTCYESVNEVFSRVVYKNNYAAAVKTQNLYPMFGGTNWGNLGYPVFITSYDVGGTIREDRTLRREKFAEMRLQGEFFKVTPAYYSSRPTYSDSHTFANTSALRVTRLEDQDSKTSLFVIRHSAYESREVTPYELRIPSSKGWLSIPRQGDTALTLHGRDSKVIVADYDLGGLNLLYSTAEIFTWKKYDDRTVLILYGGIGEAHEAALITDEKLETIEGDGVTASHGGDTLTFSWAPSTSRSVVKVGNLFIYLLDRNSAYQYFVPVLPSDDRGAYGTSEANPKAVIVRAGYLVRSAQISDSTLKISADFNRTTEVEIVGSPSSISTLEINGNRVETTSNKAKNLQAEVKYNAPELDLPDLSQVTWKYIDALPEIKAEYDDSSWVTANRRHTNNTFEKLKTPTVLYSGEYGFHTGYLIYRGHFIASGTEKIFNVTTVGGAAFGSSIWLNDTYLGSWQGDVSSESKAVSYDLPSLAPGKPYVLTVLVDNNGYEMNFEVGVDTMKTARGITDFALGANNQTRIHWKLTGNLGGEDYQDQTRGPKNEGGSYPERQGWHQPGPPSSDWQSASPMKPVASGPGLSFYITEFELSMPSGWDIPLSIEFARTSTPAKKYRVQLFVNGWQFGKHNGHLGPQTSFPVPEGILNYHGKNTIALTLWSQEKGEGAAALDGISFKAGPPVLSDRQEVKLVESPSWSERKKAY